MSPAFDLVLYGATAGYLGSVALLLWRNFGDVNLDWVQFLVLSAYATSLFGIAATGQTAGTSNTFNITAGTPT